MPVDDDGLFAEWFRRWYPSRPEMTPLGWYTSADLEVSFNAGMAAEQQRATSELLRDLPPKKD